MAAGGLEDERSRLLRELEVDLECPICMEIFGDPRSLTCGHIFCKPCLEKLVKEQYRVDAVIERYIICPECRCRDVFSYGETVADLQRPLTLRKLADFRERIVTFLDAKSDVQSCDFCDETSEAQFYCYQCLLNLCTDCLEDHNSQKTFQQHAITSLKRDAKCRCQKKKPVTAFCHDCQGLFCAVCIIRSHPKHHRTQDVKTAAAERRELLGNIVPSIKFQIEKFHAVKDTVEQVDKNIDVIFSEIKKQIEIHQYRLMDALKEKMSELKIELEQTQEEEKRKLKVLIEDNEDSLTSKVNLVRSMERLLEESSDIDILLRSADFQSVIESQPFGNIKKGLPIKIPKFFPVSPNFQGLDLGKLETNKEIFKISGEEEPEADKDEDVNFKAASIEAPKIPPRNKVPVINKQSSAAENSNGNGRSRRKERRRQVTPSPTNLELPSLPVTQNTLLAAQEPEVSSSQPSLSLDILEERHLDCSPVRLPKEAVPKRRKLRIPVPGRYSQFRLVSELINCESSLVRDFKFNQNQHQLYVSTDDNNEPIQVYDFGMQKLGSIGRGVVNDVQQLCIDEYANNVAIISDKGDSIKLLNAFGQLKQITNCTEITRVWDIALCRERGCYVVAYQDAAASSETAGCLNWGVALIDPISNIVACKSEATYQFHSIPNVCYLSHLEAVVLSDHCCIKLFDLTCRLIGDIGENDLQGVLIKDTCEGHGGHLLAACEETMDIRAVRFGAKGGDYYQYGLAQGLSIVNTDQLLGGKPKLVDISKDGFLAVQTVGKYRPRRAHSRAPLISRLQIFSGSYLGH